MGSLIVEELFPDLSKSNLEAIMMAKDRALEINGIVWVNIGHNRFKVGSNSNTSLLHDLSIIASTIEIKERDISEDFRLNEESKAALNKKINNAAYTIPNFTTLCSTC